MHVQRIIFSFIVTTSIVCTASANTADIMVIFNDLVVNIEDDASVFQGIYSGPFEYIDIIKMFNSKGFSVDDRYDHASQQRLLTLVDCNYDSCRVVKTIAETPSMTTYLYKNVGDSIRYVETLSKDIYRIKDGSFANPKWHAGLFDIGMTEKNICGRLKLNIPQIDRLVVIRTTDIKSSNLVRKRSLIPLYTEYEIFRGRITKIVMQDTLPTEIYELLYPAK